MTAVLTVKTQLKRISLHLKNRWQTKPITRYKLVCEQNLCLVASIKANDPNRFRSSALEIHYKKHLSTPKTASKKTKPIEILYDQSKTLIAVAWKPKMPRDVTH